MKKTTLQKYFIVIFLLSTGIFSEILNPQFCAHRHYTNIRYMGLSNAGVAIPEPATSILLNPALIHSWHWKNGFSYAATAAYENDSVFSRHVISTGGSWQVNEVTTVGSLYRNLKRADNNYQNDIIICVAGRLFDKSLNQGAVNLGMNIRLETLRWENLLDSLPVHAHVYDDTGAYKTTELISKYKSSFSKSSLKETRLLFDLGFYQDEIFPGMDFGLTFHNLFTRHWKSDKPTGSHVYDTTYDTVLTDIFIDTVYNTTVHTSKWTDSKGRFPKVYKRMTVGLAYHAPIMQEKVMVVLPFDVEFLGLFDKKQDIKVGLHTGIEAWFIKKIGIRFGYAYAPDHILGTPGDITFESSHILSGGASVHFEKVRFGVYIKKQDWGIGSTVTF